VDLWSLPKWWRNMGRWAQARRRGTAPDRFSVPAPTPEDFEVQEGGDGGANVALLVGPPDPSVDLFLVRFRGPFTGGLWNQTAGTVGVGEVTFAEGASGTTLEIQVAWAVDPIGQVSDWSTSVFFAVP
jgi:hypothetical protein